MGCDIHVVLESRKLGASKWIGQWCSDNMPYNRRPKFAQRDYGFFSRFSVRGRTEKSVIYPRNVPEDVSDLAWSHYMRSPTDHHSVSHCTPAEFTGAWIDENPDDSDVRSDFALWDLLQIDTDEGLEHRLVFWFDN